MVTLVWTKNDSILSKLIRWTFKEPVSHFGIVFDKKILFHSNLLGTHVEFVDTFKRKNWIVLWTEIGGLTLPQEEDIFQGCIQIDRKPYDFKAFFYFAWRGFLYRFFKLPLPYVNNWNEPSNFLCQEGAIALARFIPIDRDKLSMLTPYKYFQHVQSVVSEMQNTQGEVKLDTVEEPSNDIPSN